jgi:hypothetical protein
VRISQAEVALWGAAIALVGTLVTANYTYSSRNRELDIELVKLGVNILRADPKETQTQGAREWAIDVIQKFSGVPFSPDARKELLGNKLNLAGSSSFLQSILPQSSLLDLPVDPGAQVAFDRWASSVTIEETRKFMACQRKYEKYFAPPWDDSKRKDAPDWARKMDEECNPIVHLDADNNPVPVRPK